MRPVFKIDLYAQDVQDATIPGKERKVREGRDRNGLNTYLPFEENV